MNLVLEELYITTDENYYNRSQSLQDQRNRLWVVIGMDTIDELNIRINIPKRQVLLPNPYYQIPTQKKDMKIKGRFYPDLSIEDNRRLEISTLTIKERWKLSNERIQEIKRNAKTIK